MKKIGLKMKVFIGAIIILVGGFTAAYKLNRTVFIVTQIVLHDYIYSSTKFRVDKDKVYMTGYICRFTPKQLKNIIDKNPQIKTIVLEEVKGSLDDASNFPMGRYVRKMGLNTYVKKNSVIESGGVDFFLSGIERTLEDGAIVGVHSWQGLSSTEASVEAKDIPKNDVRHRDNADYVKDMLRTEDFYWYTIYAAPADGIHEMTLEEIKKYNVATKIIL